MEIKEIRDKKILLQHDIAVLIRAFNKDTDTYVAEIDLNVTRMNSMYEVNTYIYDVEVELDI